MDGNLMSELHGNLHRLSEASFKKLKNHFAGNTLTWQEELSLRNEITKHKAMSRVPNYND
jgi:hypothetical protein